MSAFEVPPPALSDEILGSLLHDVFGKSGHFKPLVSERDQNVMVVGDDGDYVLKISNSEEEKQALDLQCATLEHLETVASDLSVPRLVKDVAGHTLARTEQGAGHFVRLVSYLDGTLYADQAKSGELRQAIGRTMGRFSQAMQGFGHPAAHQPDFLWNLDNIDLCRPYITSIEDDENRAMVQRFFDLYDARVKPILPKLRGAVIHHDANDYNLVIKDNGLGGFDVGLIDFGDIAYSRQVNELAVTMAYALMHSKDLISEGADIVAGYCSEFDLSDDEFVALPIQLAMRMVMSVCISSSRAAQFPDNDYLTISQKPAFDLLKRLDAVNPAFLTAAWRKAAGKSATVAYDGVMAWLAEQKGQFAHIFGRDLGREARMVLSLEEGEEATKLLDDPHAQWEWLAAKMEACGASYAIGRYAEDRVCYTAEAFRSPEGGKARSTHLGFDVFLPSDTPIYAPLAGEVVSVVNNDEHLSYGPTVILKHKAGEDGPDFYTLYGHLSLATLDLLKAGQIVAAGDVIGYLGSPEVNVGWVPHLHFQIITDMLGQYGDFFGVGEPGRMDVWSEISPDPNLIVGLDEASFDLQQSKPDELMPRRKASIGPSLSVSYKNPVKMVGGDGPFLIDHTGRRYLDLVNNICHVGHCHPHVVKALSEQAKRLNTNTRYLHDNIVNYAERLTATMPDPLSVCYFTCSGSEANELAMRLARTVTGNSDMICVDWAYHGNSAANIAISPYKFNRSGGAGCPESTQIAQIPDPYRGPHKGYGRDAGEAYAKSVAERVEAIQAKGHAGPAAFIAESMLGCGGQVVMPDGYLEHAYQHVRAAGGLCIADEVQVGFGRDGEFMWAFESQGVVPDIAVLGKPIGNGHPMAAVVTTPEIAEAFANGMEYFNSFGGNPVSCAVGMAVLDVIEGEGLQQNARERGEQIQAGFREMAKKFDLIGDVRGRGLYIGVELVRDHETLEPATEEAGRITNILRANGVLMSTDGPYDNVLKIKPPIVITAELVEEVLAKTEAAFEEVCSG